MEIVKIMNLTKYYGKARGIIDLNLSVNEGECFGFIGPNGAGKSTTIRSLLGLITPTSGEAQIFGKDIQKEKHLILKEIGYLPSEAMFYHGMKVKDILKLSADMRKMNCTKEARELCERLQLDTSRKVEELSFGNRKKVAIVCALQSNPKLLILDEPTGGLDPLMQREFFEIIRERNQHGTTIFLSSHILSEIQQNCTKAGIIKEGTLIACDKVSVLSKTNAKRITVKGRVVLDGLDGIRDRIDTDDSIRFLYHGDMNLLLQRLSMGHILDLDISEPNLEEIFLHYYEKDGDRT